MKAIVILPGEKPTIKEVREDIEVIKGWKLVRNLENLHMKLISCIETYDGMRARDIPENGCLNIGEKSFCLRGPAVICRENAAGKYTDVRLCDLGLIQACWTPHRPRLEEKEHREDD